MSKFILLFAIVFLFSCSNKNSEIEKATDLYFDVLEDSLLTLTKNIANEYSEKDLYEMPLKEKNVIDVTLGANELDVKYKIKEMIGDTLIIQIDSLMILSNGKSYNYDKLTGYDAISNSDIKLIYKDGKITKPTSEKPKIEIVED